jgi:ubiquitin-protein ligase
MDKSFTQYRIKREIERGLSAETKYDDTQLLLEVGINGKQYEIRFTEKYPFHAPAVVCAGEYMNLRMLWPDVWKATYTINNIIQALTTEEPVTEDLH